jgi:hypothetical protein
LGCTRYWHTPDEDVVWKGVQWVVLSYEFAEYVVMHEKAGRWIKFLAGSFGSDETFFPSVLLGSPFKDTSIDQFHFMYTVWSTLGCQSYKPERAYGNSPCFLGEQDVPNVKKAMEKSYLFARKFKADEHGVKSYIVNEWRL